MSDQLRPDQTRFNIQVSDKDIAKAQVNNSYKCVVAHAIARTISDATHIEVDVQSVRFSRHGRRLVYLTPYTVAGYVVAFDAGEKLRPFSFHLRNPMPLGRGRQTAAGRARKKASNAAARQIHPGYGQRKHRKDISKETLEEARAAAKAAYEVAAIEHPGPTLEPKDPNLPYNIPTVFKRRERHYGHRMLRINQQQEREKT